MRAGLIQYLPCGAVLFSVACASTAPSTPLAAGGETTSTDGHADGQPTVGSTDGHNGTRTLTRHPLLDGRDPTPDSALPRLNYKHLGMHIGGESNAPSAKRPWFADIERSEDAILSCYRFVDDPQKGGSYGVDLYVGGKGGSPEVRGSRQKLGGEEFDRCMREAFASIHFHRPERPTVFSYSIFFELED